MQKAFTIFLLLLSILNAYRINPYRYSITGINSSSLGGTHASPIFNIETLFNNTAVLPFLKKGGFTYEIKTGLKFIGISSDYNLNFDVISAIGFQYKTKDYNPKSPNWGIAYYSLFQSTPQTSRSRISTPAFNIKKVSYIRGFLLNKHSAIGINAGVAIASERIDKKAYKITMFPSLELSYINFINRELSFGIHLLPPLYLNWGLFKDTTTKETTPFIGDFALNYQLSPALRLYGEISYQGWDWIIFKQDTTTAPIDRGNSAFDPFQNIFLNAGISIEPEKFHLTKNNNSELKLEKRKLHEDRIEILLPTNIQPYITSNYILKKQFDKMGDTIRVFQLHPLTSDERKEVSKQNKLIRETKKEITKTAWSISNLELIFGYAEEHQRLEEQINLLNEKILKIKTTIYNIRFKQISKSEKEIIEDFRKKMRTIRETINKNNRIVSSIRKAHRKKLLRIKQDYLDGQNISDQNKTYLKLALRLEQINNEIKIISKKEKNNNKIRKVTGQFFLGFRPEITYDQFGHYSTIGNLTFGASLRSNKHKNLFIKVHFQDQVILGYTIFHDNTLIETIKISFEILL